jgi:hypothetical protein
VFSSIYAQNSIEGRILNAKNRETIQFALIANITNQQEVISKKDGCFKIAIKNSQDIIIVHLIGYKNDTIQLQPQQRFYEIFLESNYTSLNEVTIKGKKKDYLYDLLLNCRNKWKNQNTLQAKTYYEQKTYMADHQVELVEAFYNADIKGYDIKDLHIKNGRFALQSYNGRTFASLEGCQLFTMSKLFDKNMQFPVSPVEMITKSDLKKHFKLQLEAISGNGIGDTIWLINFSPYQTNGLFYDGDVLINISKKQISKITLHSNTKNNHPFLPISQRDSILNAEINVEKNFKEIDGEMYFNYIIFSYILDYKSKIGTEDESTYQVKNSGLLYAYDFEHLFNLPWVEFYGNSSDYYKMSALPYNDFFWNYNEEYLFHDNIANNNHFYFNKNSLIDEDLKYDYNQTITSFPTTKLFLHWSNLRHQFYTQLFSYHQRKRPVLGAKFSDFQDLVGAIPNSDGKNIGKMLPPLRTGTQGSLFAGVVVLADYYNFGVQLFMDIDMCHDSTHIITDVIMDPYQRKYKLLPDNDVNCMFNTWFDIVEIYRREFEQKVCNLKDIQSINAEFSLLEKKINQLKKEFSLDVDLGFNHTGLRKWNKKVYQELGIDNTKYFKIELEMD